MTKAVRILLAMAALMAPAAIVAGCGGVPGNAVAEVDGNAIEKESYDHWLQVAARTSGQGANAKASSSRPSASRSTSSSATRCCSC